MAYNHYFLANLLRFGYYVTKVNKRIYSQNKGGFIMQQFQTSFFYGCSDDPSELFFSNTVFTILEGD